MTVARLHNLLGKMIDKGHARKEVLVNKETFTSNLEADGVTMLPISGVIIRTIHIADGDGGTKTRADGSECNATALLIFGMAGEPTTGQTYEATHPPDR